MHVVVVREVLQNTCEHWQVWNEFGKCSIHVDEVFVPKWTGNVKHVVPELAALVVWV